MKISELLKTLDELFPFERQEKWDNSGLILGAQTNVISGIILCLDVNLEIVELAKEKKINTIISHHPFVFKGIKKVTDSNMTEKLFKKVIKEDINIIAVHTNLDFADYGINDYLCELLGIYNVKGYCKLQNKEFTVGRFGQLGKTAEIKDFVKHIAKSLSLDNLRYTGAKNDKVKSVLVTTGAFDEELTPPDTKKIDTIITSDTKYHSVKDLYDKGIKVIDINHFGSEYKCVELLEKMLTKKEVNVRITKATIEKDVYNFM